MSKKKEIDTSFDFGFSAVDEKDIMQPAVEEAQAEVAHSNAKAERIIAMVMPLLDHLAANPDKAYIYWPNRLEKIEQFKIELERAAR